MKSVLVVFNSIALLVGLMLMSCGTEPEEDVLTTVSVSPSIATIAVGQDIQFAAQGYNQDGTGMTGLTFSWSLGDTTKASISNDGLATALQIGTVSITATSEGVSGSANLTVISTPIYSITVSPSSANVDDGETQQFTALAKDSLGNDIPDSIVFLWESSNTSIATVDDNGLAIGESVGDAYIIASAGSISDSALLTVQAQPIPHKIAFVSSYGGQDNIYIVSEDGTGLECLTFSDANYVEPAWHPNGHKLAFSCNKETDFRIWVMDVSTGDMTKLTNGPGLDKWPSYSPDGSQIAFSSNRGGNFDIWIMNADGTGAIQLTDNIAMDIQPSWSGDGAYIAFTSDRTSVKNIWIINILTTEETQITFTEGDARNEFPCVNYNGTEIAYMYSYYYWIGSAYISYINKVVFSDTLETHTLVGGHPFITVGRPAFNSFGNKFVFSRQPDLGVVEDLYMKYNPPIGDETWFIGTTDCVDHMAAW